jgi:hypothetical protein
MKKGTYFLYTNAKGRTKTFIVSDDTPVKESEATLTLKVEYAGNPAPRKQYTRQFRRAQIKPIEIRPVPVA